MTYYAEVNHVPAQCGGKFIYNFRNWPDLGCLSLKAIKKDYGGLMLIATFNQTQREAYEKCCEIFTWLGQSTPIRNPNTDNQIFTAVFKA